MHGEMRNTYNIFVRKCEEKRPLGGSMHRRKNNIKMDLKEICWECVDWIHMA